MTEQQPVLDMRASMLSSYSDCALRAAAAQWKDEFTSRGYPINQTKMSMPAAVGIGAHAGVRYSLQEKVNTGSLGNTDEAIMAGIDQFDKEIANGFSHDEITRTPAVGHDQIAKIVRVYNGLVGYRIEPLHVEKRFKMNFRKFAPGYTGSGTIDNITKSLDLSDLKTGRKMHSVSHVMQISFYKMLLRSNRLPPKRSGTVTIKRPAHGENMGDPVIQWFDAEYDYLAEEMAMQIIHDMQKFRATGSLSAFRKNPNSLYCSRKSCPAFAMCPFGKLKDQFKT